MAHQCAEKLLALLLLALLLLLHDLAFVPPLPLPLYLVVVIFLKNAPNTTGVISVQFSRSLSGRCKWIEIEPARVSAIKGFLSDEHHLILLASIPIGLDAEEETL